MVTAIAAAILVSITAAVVLNLTWRRLELSAFRTDREIGLASAEAGLQYAFARLDADAALRTTVTDRGSDANPNNNIYLITCDQNIPAGQRDELVPGLHVSTKINTERNADGTPGPLFGTYVGGKHVTVRIRFLRPQDNPPDPNRPFLVDAVSEYGRPEPAGGQPRHPRL